MLFRSRRSRAIRALAGKTITPISTEEASRTGQIDVAALQGVLLENAVARGGVHTLRNENTGLPPASGPSGKEVAK